MNILPSGTYHGEGSQFAVERPDGTTFWFRQIRDAADHGKPVSESRFLLEVAVHIGTSYAWYPCAWFQGSALPTLAQISSEQRAAQSIVWRSAN